MQNYFGPLYFGKLNPYNSKYCSNFVLFWPAVVICALNFAVLFGSRNSWNKGHANIKGFTVNQLRTVCLQGTRPACGQYGNVLRLPAVLSLPWQLQHHSGSVLWRDFLRGQDQDAKCKVQQLFVTITVKRPLPDTMWSSQPRAMHLMSDEFIVFPVCLQLE